jgi:type VI secretion system protein ImpE
MTPYEAFAAGRLQEAVELQESLVRADPQAVSPRVALIELLLFTGELDDISTHLMLIDSDDPDWPKTRRVFRSLVRVEKQRRRSRLSFIEADTPPKHALFRWRAVKAIRDGDPARAVKWIDRADAIVPPVRGFIDGREFSEIRDADDRYASVLELFHGIAWGWFPWEVVSRVKLAPAKFAMDRFVRMVEVRLKNGLDYEGFLPMLYVGSHEADGEFATGMQTDHICPDGGPVRCIGGKELVVDGEEIALEDVTMIEIR